MRQNKTLIYWPLNYSLEDTSIGSIQIEKKKMHFGFFLYIPKDC